MPLPDHYWRQAFCGTKYYYQAHVKLWWHANTDAQQFCHDSHEPERCERLMWHAFVTGTLYRTRGRPAPPRPSVARRDDDDFDRFMLHGAHL